MLFIFLNDFYWGCLPIANEETTLIIHIPLMFIFHLHFIAAALIIITRWFANSSLHCFSCCLRVPCVLCYMLLALGIMMNLKQKKTLRIFRNLHVNFDQG